MKSGIRCFAYAFYFLVIIKSEVFSQKKWDGGGGNNQWTNPLNWNDDQVPGLNDSILLDNSILLAGYSVFLPSSNVGLSVHSVRISPAQHSTIQLVIPTDNIAVPALSLLGQPGLVLESGATFQNSSGSTSGTVLSLTDSIFILNGARFVQNSRTAHVTYISKLSRMPGTERGVFEFNVPGTASYTISLAGRTYGDLELNAIAAGGTKTYLSNGSNPGLIRGKLTIQQGVNYALDFAGEIQVRNDLYVAGILNLSSSVNSNQVKLMGDLLCFGLITETGTGFPLISLEGSSQQSVWQTGAISNQVRIRANNFQSVRLRTNLRVPYLLELAGGKVLSNDTAVLIIASGATLTADSTLMTCFVDGPIRKLDLSNAETFLFPVGKGSAQRWLSVRNASGDFEVEFFKQSANILSGTIGTGLDHISSIEYWSVKTNPAASARVELSFNDVNSGGVSDMNSLRVAALKNLVWEDAGNTGYTGSAGASGSVISNHIGIFETPTAYFTLASSNNFTNPLPLQKISLFPHTIGKNTILNWTINSSTTPVKAELQWSSDGSYYKTLKLIQPVELDRMYTYQIPKEKDATGYYRVSATMQNRFIFESGKIYIETLGEESLLVSDPRMNGAAVAVQIFSKNRQIASCLLYNNIGQLLASNRITLLQGNQEYKVDIGTLPAGIYYLLFMDDKGNRKPIRFLK